MLMAPSRLVAAPVGVSRSSDPTMLGGSVSRSPHAASPLRNSGTAKAKNRALNFAGYIAVVSRSEAKVHSRDPVADLRLREKVGGGEVAGAFPSLPEAVHLGIDSAVIVNGQEIAATEGEAEAGCPKRPGDVVGCIEGQ